MRMKSLLTVVVGLTLLAGGTALGVQLGTGESQTDRLPERTTQTMIEPVLEQVGEVAETVISPDKISFTPRKPYDVAILTAQKADVHHVKQFPFGDEISISSAELPEGTYSYELRLIQRLPEDSYVDLPETDQNGRTTTLRDAVRAAGPYEHRFDAAFTILNGKFVQPMEEPEPGAGSGQ